VLFLALKFPQDLGRILIYQDLRLVLVLGLGLVMGLGLGLVVGLVLALMVVHVWLPAFLKI
jgi:hypothetical protein